METYLCSNDVSFNDFLFARIKFALFKFKSIANCSLRDIKSFSLDPLKSLVLLAKDILRNNYFRKCVANM